MEEPTIMNPIPRREKSKSMKEGKKAYPKIRLKTKTIIPRINKSKAFSPTLAESANCSLM
jgi:hypothetical protein